MKHEPHEMLNGTTTRSLHLRADLLDDPHRLVAEDVAVLHAGRLAAVEVEVGAADRRRGDADDRVDRLLDPRVGDVLDAELLGPVPDDCLHRRRGSTWPRYVAIAPCGSAPETFISATVVAPSRSISSIRSTCSSGSAETMIASFSFSSVTVAAACSCIARGSCQSSV